jgi:hypothetical protein
MKDEEIRFIENLCTTSTLSLEEFCDKLSKELALPDFEYDAENETEWGWVEIDHIEINVSRPYESGKLQDWDESAPPDCNFGISLVVANNAPTAWNSMWSLEELVPKFAQRIANVIDKSVYHHRTWLAPGDNIRRVGVYSPVSV